jgi:hypothetical protein
MSMPLELSVAACTACGGSPPNTTCIAAECAAGYRAYNASTQACTNSSIVNGTGSNVTANSSGTVVINGSSCNSYVITQHTCNPGAPDFDRNGDVCANDGTPHESYCSYTTSSTMKCARCVKPCSMSGFAAISTCNGNKTCENAALQKLSPACVTCLMQPAHQNSTAACIDAEPPPPPGVKPCPMSGFAAISTCNGNKTCENAAMQKLPPACVTCLMQPAHQNSTAACIDAGPPPPPGVKPCPMSAFMAIGACNGNKTCENAAMQKLPPACMTCLMQPAHQNSTAACIDAGPPPPPGVKPCPMSGFAAIGACNGNKTCENAAMQKLPPACMTCLMQPAHQNNPTACIGGMGANVTANSSGTVVINGSSCNSYVITQHTCNPGAPDFDRNGDVCANDGTPHESYCSYTTSSTMECVRCVRTVASLNASATSCAAGAWSNWSSCSALCTRPGISPMRSRSYQGWAGSCAHGTLIAQQQRTQANHCGSCNSGYFLTVTKKCNKWNVCSNGEYMKVKGTGTTDRVCAAHAQQCNANQYESKAPTASSDRECKGAGSCANGALIVLINRTQANHCGSCNSGYRLLGKNCVGWAGSCAHGTLIAQQQRAQDHQCGSCNPGYRLVGRACMVTGMPTSCCNLYCDDTGAQACKADSKIIARNSVPVQFPGTQHGVDGHRVYSGSTYTIHWQATPSNTSVKISLVYAGQQSVVLAASSNGGSNKNEMTMFGSFKMKGFIGNGFRWRIAQGLNCTDCRLKVQSLSTPALANFSKPFVIRPGVVSSGRRLAARRTQGSPSGSSGTFASRCPYPPIGSIQTQKCNTHLCPCDASTAPTNGAKGDCTAALPSGSTCQPTCNQGYTVSGKSSCQAGNLTAATCAAAAIITGLCTGNTNTTEDVTCPAGLSVKPSTKGTLSCL